MSGRNEDEAWRGSEEKEVRGEGAGKGEKESSALQFCRLRSSECYLFCTL